MIWYNSTPMNKIFFLILLSLILTPKVYAKSIVDVKVNNNVSTSSNSTGSTNTNIRIEENGKITTYSSDKPENIEISSVNGKSEIKINGEHVSQKKLTNPNVSPDVKPSVKQENKKEEKKNIFEVFEKIFKTLFSLLV